VIAQIAAASSPDGPLQFFLNSTNVNAGIVSSSREGTGKLWFRIAARTILRVRVTGKASNPLQIWFNAIGYPGHGA